MRRIQFIEIHEQPWLPSSIRDEITDALQFGLNLFRAYTPVVPLLQDALDATAKPSILGQTMVGHTMVGQTIVDLCSGGGGPWSGLAPSLRTEPPGIQIWLTDQYPNLDSIQNVPQGSENRITFYADSVDAMHVPAELKGFRTMFTAFHHFSPEHARAILQNAVDAGEGIGIFEVTRRAPSTIALVLAWVSMLIVCTPWIRPFRWSRLLWTYLIPVIPLVLVFDGVVSCLRSYRPPELREMVEKLTGSNYQWNIGELSTGGTPVTYLIGSPRPF